MKKLFTEPELEILTFLCNDPVAGTADVGEIPEGEGEGEGGILPGLK